MKKNGFTLIELLAVIVILAIIALIATPIVLNIIEDSKDSSNQRSIDGYANAVEYAVAKLQIQNTTGKIAGTFTTEDGKTLTGDSTLTVDYDGDVVCDTVEVYSDGKIYLTNCRVNGEEIDYTYGEKQPISFANDSWETIIKAVQEGNISAYNIGDTKKVTLTGEVAGTYTVRIANTSTPGECNNDNFSQTACGFVIEFIDIITNKAMKDSDTNEGGWKDSNIRAYVNDTVYNALPQELKDNIINTRVISGAGADDCLMNTICEFKTDDNLYLFSRTEVFGWYEEDETKTSTDWSESRTRRLDYYEKTDDTIKNNKENISTWWLRSANHITFQTFDAVNAMGEITELNANENNGVSPAFRIG